MNCYRCNGLCREDDGLPRCIICGRIQYPPEERARIEEARARTKSKERDTRSLSELVDEQAKEQVQDKPKKKPRWHRGADLEDVGRPLKLSKLENEFARTHLISARVGR